LDVNFKKTNKKDRNDQTSSGFIDECFKIINKTFNLDQVGAIYPCLLKFVIYLQRHQDAKPSKSIVDDSSTVSASQEKTLQSPDQSATPTKNDSDDSLTKKPSTNGISKRAVFIEKQEKKSRKVELIVENVNQIDAQGVALSSYDAASNDQNTHANQASLPEENFTEKDLKILKRIEQLDRYCMVKEFCQLKCIFFFY
jgi:hypothetical protein